MREGYSYSTNSLPTEQLYPSPLALSSRARYANHTGNHSRYFLFTVGKGKIMNMQVMLALGGIIALLGSLIVGLQGWQGRRRTHITIPPQTEAPEDISPAISGMLLAINPLPEWKQVLATLFDLANKGVLVFVEETNQGARGGKIFVIQKQANTINLAEHERGLLQILFPDEHSTELPLTMLSKVYKKQPGPFTSPLRQELSTRGFLASQRQQRRKRFGTISLILFLLSLIGMVISLLVGSESTIWPVVFPALGLLVVCVVSFFLMVYHSPLSDKGMQAAKESWSFSQYLLNITRKSSHTPTTPELFERYLPIATSYGLLKPWLQYFQKQTPDHVPAWFKTSNSHPAESFATFTIVMIAANTTGNTGGGTPLPPQPQHSRSS